MSGAAAAPAAHPVAGVPVPPSPRELHPKHPGIVFQTHLSQATPAAAFDHPPEPSNVTPSPAAPAAASSAAKPPTADPTPSDYGAESADVQAALDIDLGEDANEHASVLDPVAHEDLQEPIEEMHVEPLSAPAEHREDTHAMRVDPPAATAEPGSSTKPVTDDDLLRAAQREMDSAALLDSASQGDTQRPEMPQSVIEDAVHRALRSVPQGGPSRAPQRFYSVHEALNSGLDDSLTDSMVAEEDKPQPGRVSTQNSVILQHLAAHATATPRTKRVRLMEQKSPAILARGASISLARRAAATAKKRRDEARAELERNGISEGVERALEGIVGISASTRANVSQNRERRVQRVKWREEEVTALKKGVERYGVGRWAVILREFASAFDPVRISVDLKDKWRNIFKVPKSRVSTTSRPRVILDEGAPTVMAGHVAAAIQSQAHAAQTTHRTGDPQLQNAQAARAQPIQGQHSTAGDVVKIKEELVSAEEQMERDSAIRKGGNMQKNALTQGQQQSQPEKKAALGVDGRQNQEHAMDASSGQQRPLQAELDAEAALASAELGCRVSPERAGAARKYPRLMVLPERDMMPERKRPREESPPMDDDANRNQAAMDCMPSELAQEPQMENADEMNTEHKSCDIAKGNAEIDLVLQTSSKHFSEENHDETKPRPLPDSMEDDTEGKENEAVVKTGAQEQVSAEKSADMDQEIESRGMHVEVNGEPLRGVSSEQAMQEDGPERPAIVIEMQARDEDEHVQNQMVDVNGVRVPENTALDQKTEPTIDAMQSIEMARKVPVSAENADEHNEVNGTDHADGMDTAQLGDEEVGESPKHQLDENMHDDTLVVTHDAPDDDGSRHASDDGKLPEMANVPAESAVVSADDAHLVHLSISGLATEQQPEPLADAGLETFGSRHIKVDMESVFDEQVAGGGVDMEDMRRDDGDDMVGDGQDILVHVHANGQVTQGTVGDGGGGGIHDFAV